MVTVSAETGRDAINLLQAAPDVDIVLMDIMMPEMDGIDTMRAIRQISRFKNLPIVAVTAKAMKGDREKCIEAGAWDYLSKPVDPEQMLSVLARLADGLIMELARKSQNSDWSTTCQINCWRWKSFCKNWVRPIVAVDSGAEALRRLLTEDFAVILLDVNMPDMDGFETAALIRQRKRSEHTPIIFLTAFPDDTLRRPRLFAGRGRLHSYAGRARGVADQGFGVRRPVSHDAAESNGRRRSASRWRTSMPPASPPSRPTAPRTSFWRMSATSCARR